MPLKPDAPVTKSISSLLRVEVNATNGRDRFRPMLRRRIEEPKGFARTTDFWGRPVIHSAGADVEPPSTSTVRPSDRKRSFGLLVFIRRDNEIFQTYFTSERGVEQPSNPFGFLDITPWGRQETWEDSPKGWLQEPP